MPEEIRTDSVFDELMRIQASYGDQFRWADQSLLAFWMAKHQIRPSEESQWNYMGPDYRRFAREGTEMRYDPVKPEEAIIYHINNGHSPRKGLMEAKMVATL